jgi:hypothetical protein
MKTLYPVPSEPSTDPAYLAAAAVHSLMHPLPAGTAFCIGVVLLGMMTGRFVQTTGSLARAVLPFVVHVRWGGQAGGARDGAGTVSLDALFDRATDWGLAPLPIDPVRRGREHREVHAIDSSTLARRRAGTRLALAGKGSCHRAGRAVRAHIVAALTAVVMMQGGAWRPGASHPFWPSQPRRGGARLRCAAAHPGDTAPRRGCWHGHQGALCRGDRAGRLAGAPTHSHQVAVCASPPTGKRGRRPLHGEGSHPGRDVPEVAPDVERHLPGEAGLIRLRRWPLLHAEECPTMRLDVERIDDPAYDTPLLVGPTACELTREECWVGYGPRWPVETHCFGAQDTTAMERPRAWPATALERRISWAL